MADSRSSGIEKIAHLFIAGHGASAPACAGEFAIALG